jgi:DNA-binding NtrC family response regulator
MPRETQNKILRVLVDQTFQRSGGTTKVHVDVRIISSTARNLEEEIAEGRFREDLYHRLSVVPIRVPPLSERREDIPELIDYFMDQISVATGLPKRRRSSSQPICCRRTSARWCRRCRPATMASTSWACRCARRGKCSSATT